MNSKQSNTKKKMSSDKIISIVGFSFLGIFILVETILNITRTDPEDIYNNSKERLNQFVIEYNLDSNYSILLNDMDYIEKEDKYYHQYKILKFSSKPDTVFQFITDWITVDPVFFNEHSYHLGMTIKSKNGNTEVNSTSPPGYENIYGNSNYGGWDENNSWYFFDDFLYLSDYILFHSYPPIYFSDYSYYRTAYRNRNTYYSRDAYGRAVYGTNSNYSSNAMKKRKWNNNSSTRRSQIMNQATSRANTLKSSFGGKRSGRSSSSMRSRGGGFGK